jgi:hypothetical protein
VLTTGHEATDARIYGKQATSLQRLGLDVTVVGKLEFTAAGAVPVVVIPLARSRWRRFLWQPWRCLWAARKISADIVHFHDPEMLITLPLAKLWWWHSKFVYDVHEDIGNLMLVRDWLPSWLKPAVRLGINILEKALAPLADGIIGVTPPLTERFHHRHKIVAYNFVAEEFFSFTGAKKVGEREIDVVHVGTLTTERALFLLDTLRQFHAWKPTAHSLVAGVSSTIERLLRERLPKQSLLLPRMEHREIAAYLGNAKIGLDVHPEAKPHLEVALPVKVCEYMAAGCAVVCSSMPVLNRLLDEARVSAAGLVRIDGGKPADFAKAMVDMIERIDAGLDPGADLRAIAACHMAWEGEVEKIHSLYSQILERPCVA